MMIKQRLAALIGFLALSSVIFADTPAPRKSPKWSAVKPTRVTSLVKEEKGVVLKDGSVRFQGDVPWSEATLSFKFDKPRVIERIRVELLPRDEKSRQLGRGQAPLWLFDIKPHLRRDGKVRYRDWKSAFCPQRPKDETVPNCIDYLTDTGWRTPELRKNESRYELILKLDQPVRLAAGEQFDLTFDSGGAPDLGVVARVRVSLPAEKAESK